MMRMFKIESEIQPNLSDSACESVTNCALIKQFHARDLAFSSGRRCLRVWAFIAKWLKAQEFM